MKKLEKDLSYLINHLITDSPPPTEFYRITLSHFYDYTVLDFAYKTQKLAASFSTAKNTIIH